MNSHFGNGHFLKKMDTQPSILEILSKKKSKKNENVSINNSQARISIAVLFILDKTSNRPGVHREMALHEPWCVHTAPHGDKNTLLIELPVWTSPKVTTQSQSHTRGTCHIISLYTNLFICQAQERLLWIQSCTFSLPVNYIPLPTIKQLRLLRLTNPVLLVL